MEWHFWFSESWWCSVNFWAGMLLSSWKYIWHRVLFWRWWSWNRGGLMMHIVLVEWITNMEMWTVSFFVEWITDTEMWTVSSAWWQSPNMGALCGKMSGEWFIDTEMWTARFPTGSLKTGVVFDEVSLVSGLLTFSEWFMYTEMWRVWFPKW